MINMIILFKTIFLILNNCLNNMIFKQKKSALKGETGATNYVLIVIDKLVMSIIEDVSNCCVSLRVTYMK